MISKDDKTRIASGVCAAFHLYTLVTSATPDTCPKHALNTRKALHEHAVTPGPRIGQHAYNQTCSLSPHGIDNGHVQTLDLVGLCK